MFPWAAEAEDTGSALHQAAYDGQLQLVLSLIAEGADLSQTRPSDGKTALHVAVEEGQAQIVKVLLEAHKTAADASGATQSSAAPLPCVLWRDQDGWLPLHWAAYYGDVAAGTALLAHSCAPQQVIATTFGGQAALDIALQMSGSQWTGPKERSHYPDFLKLLHGHGVDVPAWRAQDGSLETALHVAVREGAGADVLQTLVDLGVPVDARTGAEAGGFTALHLAVAAGNSGAVGALLKAGAGIDSGAVESALTPLMMAAQQERVDMVELLVPTANPLLCDTAGLSVVALALLHASSEQAADDITNALLRAAVCDPTVVDSWVQPPGAGHQDASQRAAPTTALHVACARGWPSVVKLLLGLPARVQSVTGSVTSKDQQGNTPLEVLQDRAQSHTSHTECMSLLKQHQDEAAEQGQLRSLLEKVEL